MLWLWSAYKATCCAWKGYKSFSHFLYAAIMTCKRKAWTSWTLDSDLTSINFPSFELGISAFLWKLGYFCSSTLSIFRHCHRISLHIIACDCFNLLYLCRYLYLTLPSVHSLAFICIPQSSVGLEILKLMTFSLEFQLREVLDDLERWSCMIMRCAQHPEFATSHCIHHRCTFFRPLSWKKISCLGPDKAKLCNVCTSPPIRSQRQSRFLRTRNTNCLRPGSHARK